MHDGKILERRHAAVGVRDSALAGSTLPIRVALRGLLAPLASRGQAEGVIAAGMITSSLGLANIPHVYAPASSHDLARAAVTIDAPDVTPLPVTLIPGVRTPGAEMDGITEDVMRGEETLCLGLATIGAIRTGSAVLNAGSHWKLISIDEDGRIAWSRTSLGGEVVHAVQAGTLLKASLPTGPLVAIERDWLERGAAASSRDGLLRALFAVRLLDQRGGSTPEERFSWLVGACIGDDMRALLRSDAIRAGMRVAVSGPGAIPAAWCHLLQASGCSATPLDPPVVEQALVAGAIEVASLQSRMPGATS